MSTISKINEEYANTRTLKILPRDHLEIPGLRLFGRQIRTAAVDALPPHAHGDCFEIVYVCSGSPSFSVGESTYALCGGEIFVTQPHQIHSTSSMPVSVSEIYWLQLDLLNFPDALFLDSKAGKALLSRLLALPCPRITADLGPMKKLMQSAFRSACTGDNPQLTAAYLTLFLQLMLEHANDAQSKISPDIENALEYIRSNLSEKLPLEDLAGICYLSASQFKQKFKQQMGVAPRQFINSQKIQAAKALLLKGLSTAEAAEALGFESVSYFITVFRRYTSCTPGEYKQEHRDCK